MDSNNKNLLETMPPKVAFYGGLILAILGFGAIGFISLLFYLFVDIPDLSWLKPTTAIGAGLGFGGALLLGLGAGSSSCIAVSGGLLLSSAAKFNARYGNASTVAKMRPVFLFVVGRTVGYGLFGGLIGLVGNALALPPKVIGIITIFAALYMVIMGLSMLHITPRWLIAILPRMPKMLAHKVLDVEEKDHPLVPALLGAGTFFLPCGFTQGLQLYALSVGDPSLGAGLLAAFALGTAPALFALGLTSSSLKGKLGKLFFKVSGALVIILGLWNVQNGLTIIGKPLSFNWLLGARVSAARIATDSAVTFDGDIQTINMQATLSGYKPNGIVVKAGVPTQWRIFGERVVGCTSIIQAPALGVRQLLKQGETTTIDLGILKPGTFNFSCSMGMFTGKITAVQ